MAQLPQRSTADTRAEHISDHNELHRLHDIVDALGSLATDAEVTAAIAALSSTYAPLLTQVAKSANYTAAVNEYVLATNSSSFTVTLPLTPATGSVVRIKTLGGQPLTVAPQSPNTIDGNANHIIRTQNMDITFRFDGTVWRTGPAYLPFVYLQYQIATATNPAGGNSNFCLVVPNQITTGSANDGVHDLVFVVGNNPAIGDADFLFTRGADNAVGVAFMHVPLKFATGFDFIVQDNGNVPRLRWSQSTGNLTLSGGSMVFNSLYGLTFSMASGSAATVSSDSSSRLNISGGSGGIRFLNNAFSAVNLTLSDAGDLTLGGHLNMTAGKFLTIGGPASLSFSSNRLDISGGSTSTRFLNAALNATNLEIADNGDHTFRGHLNMANGKFLTIGGAACLQYDGSSRLNIAGGTGGMRFLNAAFAVVNATIADNGDVTLKNGVGFWGHAAVAAQPAAPVTLADVIAVIRGCGLAA